MTQTVQHAIHPPIILHWNRYFPWLWVKKLYENQMKHKIRGSEKSFAERLQKYYQLGFSDVSFVSSKY